MLNQCLQEINEADNMDEVIVYLNKLFTPAQQTALIVITFSVSMLTQAFKNIYFGFHKIKDKQKKKAVIWLFALLAGFCGGLIGYYTAIPKQPLWFWIFSGVSAGGMAIGSFIIVVEKIYPRLKGKKNEN
jgi:hypothetical protein